MFNALLGEDYHTLQSYPINSYTLHTCLKCINSISLSAIALMDFEIAIDKTISLLLKKIVCHQKYMLIDNTHDDDDDDYDHTREANPRASFYISIEINLKKKSYRVWMLRFRQQHCWPVQFSPGWLESRWMERRPGKYPQPIRQTVTSIRLIVGKI